MACGMPARLTKGKRAPRSMCTGGASSLAPRSFCRAAAAPPLSSLPADAAAQGSKRLRASFRTDGGRGHGRGGGEACLACFVQEVPGAIRALECAHAQMRQRLGCPHLSDARELAAD